MPPKQYIDQIYRFSCLPSYWSPALNDLLLPSAFRTLNISFETFVQSEVNGPIMKADFSVMIGSHFSSYTRQDMLVEWLGTAKSTPNSSCEKEFCNTRILLTNNSLKTVK